MIDNLADIFCIIKVKEEMKGTSYQTTHYDHAQQVQIQGQSGLKIFDGEDLSRVLFM